MSTAEKTTYVVVSLSGRRHGTAGRDGETFSRDPISGHYGERIPISGRYGEPLDTAAHLRISLQQKSCAEAQELRQDPDTVAIATQMPLNLIAPLAGSAAMAATAAAGASCAWGVGAVGAHTSRYTGKGVVVAVLDTGIDRNHPAFSRFDQNSLVEKDFTGQGNGDWNGHGTHCAATLFGGDIGGIRVGVAPGISRALVGKVIGSNGTSTVALVEAMAWAAAEGAQVISMSLKLDMVGYAQQMIDKGTERNVAFSRALKAYRENTRLFDTLGSLLGNSPQIGREALFVAATGNASRRDISPPQLLSADLPASSHYVIPVGAVDEIRKVATFSNTDPLLVAPGVNILSACKEADLIPLSGTSMAVPHVAGCAALWIEQQRVTNRDRLHPRWLERVRSALVEHATALPEDPEDVGVGLVQAPQ